MKPSSKILDRLFSTISKRSGEKVLHQFERLLETSGYSNILSNATEIKLNKTFYENKTNKPHKLVFFTNLTNSKQTIESLYDIFVRSASHCNPLGHFRDSTDFYSNIYSNLRYFLFHGDGNCFAVSMIFQGFIRKFLGDKIQVHYGCLPDRSYMHTYCMNEKDYIDPDQKTFMTKEQMIGDMPKGFMYSLISFAGFDVYDAYNLEAKNKLFPRMTYGFLKDFYVNLQPAIYQDVPSLEVLKKSFNEVYKSYSEIVKIELDDYPWKPNYRKSVKNLLNTEIYFFSEIEKPLTLMLPEKSSFQFGFSERQQLPKEVFDLSCVYFGRVPGTLSYVSTKGNLFEITVPEFPWMIIFKNYFGPVTVNNVILELYKSKCGQFGILGMGDLETVTNFSHPEFKYHIHTPFYTGNRIDVILPINANAVNSGILELEYKEQ